MASYSESSATGTGNSNRFSNGSLLSIRTLVPEYTAAEPSTFANRFSNASFFSIRTLLPQYDAVDAEPIPDYCEDAHEFRYAFPIRPKNPWVTLHIHTRDSVPGETKSLQSQPRSPRLWSCDPLRGTVELDLDSPQNIQQITITLKGNIVVSSDVGGSVGFLNREFTVWNKSMINPSQSNNADSESNSTQKQKRDTRLAPGQYIFPFSFPFPAHADPTSANGPKSAGEPARTWTRGFSPLPNESSSSSASERLRSETLGSDQGHSSAPPLPQTFMEKDVDPNVEYSMSVRIVHGRFNTSSKIKTKIAYFPASEPPPASQKRRAAYEAGALLPCPMNDPAGWFALPTVTIPGVVKTDHGSVLPTSVDCTLYIAQPLSFTRGSVVPCFITIHSDGVKIAHLLPGTEKPIVRLLRRLWHPLVDGQADIGGYRGSQITRPTSGVTLVTHEVGRANWWMPSKEVVQGPNTRHLEGEIRLSPELKPSCDFQLFRTEYVVQLLSFQTANFTPEIHPSSKLRKGLDNVIASNIVEITTMYRKDEPVPTAYSGVPETYLNRHISTERAWKRHQF